MKDKIILIGGGGHCKVIIDAIINADKYDIEGVLDSKFNVDFKILGFSIIGGDDKLPEIRGRGVKNAFVSVGSIGKYALRRHIYEKVKIFKFNVPVIIHPRSVVAYDVSIDEGTFVAASATINSGTRIGKNVIVNTSSSIDHDCVIGDFAHVSPGVILCGGVSVGEGTHIGVGAKVIQGVHIGKDCFIKAGHTVCGNVAAGSVYPGEK
ncbi:MAG: acetyltransferase [Candidatus Omnitrophota bacterium]|nr:acetyltransferase [Candidatus Omnitrophota bacterium]